MSSPETREDWIVREARKRPRAEQSSFLDGACAGDAELRQRMEASLTQGQAVAAPMPDTETETMKASLPDGSDDAVGQTLGRYKLLEKIGEGGFGAVYVAEQKEPVKRRVALKIIKLGMDTRQVVARFEAERQALALMDHPNIARVLDAGATDSGRPYFVMELVRGVRVTQYCDQNRLSTRQRLELFIPICQAIQHAHQKGIIHRDIKPSNILVALHDGVPVPKVIDFGIAKATQQDLTDKTVYTQLQQFIGTPAYMSPEQAEMSGLDVDTRSDIYSLGVLLYELLTGGTPFDAKELMAQGIDAMRKTIREKEPPRPSTKVATLQGEELTTTAARHAIEAPKLISLLRGDLDWIVMKCLEKDRTRRYETANGVAMDIKRHLGNEPVMARPPSKLYEFQKTFRRHKIGFIATGSVIVALAIGVALASWQAMLAMQAKSREAVQRQKAQANEQKAVEASGREAGLRRQAEVQELAARQRAYASDMNVAAQALQGNNWGRGVNLLNRQRPAQGQVDLRRWEWRYLWQQVRSDALFTLCRHSSEINSLAVSPNGSLLAIGNRHSGGVSVWDLGTRRELARLAEGESYGRAVFSPTEPILALSSFASVLSGQGQDRLRVWNSATRQMVGEVPLEGSCLGLVFAKDGRTLAISSVRRLGGTSTTTGGTIAIWRIPECTRVSSIQCEQSGVDPGTPFACAADLSVAAYGSDDGRIHVIDLIAGKEIWSAVASKENIAALAMSPDGKTLASGAGFAESDIRLWKVATGEPIGRLAGHNSWVSSIVFWPDGKRLASTSADQTLRVWDVASQQCLDVLRGHRQEVWRLALLPDGKTLLSGSKDGMVCVWDTSVAHPHRSRLTFSDHIVTWASTPGDRSIVTLNRDGRVSEWSGADFQQENRMFEISKSFTARYSKCIFSAGAGALAIGYTNGVLEVWDISRRDLKRQWTAAAGEVRPEAFVASGTRLVTTSMVKGLHQEWDLGSGLALQSWNCPGDFTELSVPPDEQKCLAFGYGGDFVLRALTDKTDRRLPLNAVEAVAGSFSTDGRLFAIASDMGYARLWNTAKWEEVATLGGVLMGMNSASFAADGKRLVISSNGLEAVKLFDTDSWQEVFTLDAFGTGARGANGIRFSSDGNSIFWRNTSDELYMWRAPSWDEIRAVEARELAEEPRP